MENKKAWQRRGIFALVSQRERREILDGDAPEDDEDDVREDESGIE